MGFQDFLLKLGPVCHSLRDSLFFSERLKSQTQASRESQWDSLTGSQCPLELERLKEGLFISPSAATLAHELQEI